MFLSGNNETPQTIHSLEHTHTHTSMIHYTTIFIIFLTAFITEVITYSLNGLHDGPEGILGSRCEESIKVGQRERRCVTKRMEVGDSEMNGRMGARN